MNPFKEDLDPEKLTFDQPDFGFNDGLKFEESAFDQDRLWRIFMDHMQFKPKYERLEEFIQFMKNVKTDKKFRSQVDAIINKKGKTKKNLETNAPKMFRPAFNT